MRMYGNVINRLYEDKDFVDTIEVGTGMTEYLWSDRHAYEVIEVKDQRHVTVRELDAKCIGGAYSNEWELYSNENNRTVEMAMRKNRWYRIYRDEKGKIYHWERMRVSFGRADYYYDYSF